MFLLTQRITHYYNRIIGSRLFPLFNFLLFICYPIHIYLLKVIFLPRPIKLFVLINIFFYSRYNHSFVEYRDNRHSLLEFLSGCVPQNEGEKERAIAIKLECFLEQNDYQSAEKLFHKIKDDYNFPSSYSIFANKRVLYIGSAPVNHEELDFQCFDLIVVSNFLEVDFERKKIPLDKAVIFFNKGFAGRHAEHVARIKKRCKTVFVKQDSAVHNASQFMDASPFMFNDYGPMGAQNVLLGLYVGQPSSVTVVGINGFLSSKPFADDLKKYSINDQHISNILRRHELVSNHNFLRLINHLINVRGNDEFLALVKLNSHEYCLKIDQLYGRLGAKRIAGYGF